MLLTARLLTGRVVRGSDGLVFRLLARVQVPVRRSDVQTLLLTAH